MLKRSSIWKYSKTLSNAELFCKFHRCSFCQYHALLLHSCKFDVLTWMICWPIGCIVKMCWGFYAQLLRIIKTLIHLNTLSIVDEVVILTKDSIAAVPLTNSTCFGMPTNSRGGPDWLPLHPQTWLDATCNVRQACFLRWEHVANLPKCSV